MKKSEIKVGLRVSVFAPENSIFQMAWEESGEKQKSRWPQVNRTPPTAHLFNGDRQSAEVVELNASRAERTQWSRGGKVVNDGVLVRLDESRRLVCLTTRQVLEPQADFEKRTEAYKAATVRHHEDALTRHTELRTKIERVEGLLTARGVTRDAIRRETTRVEQSEYIRKAAVHLTLDEVIELLGEVA